MKRDGTDPLQATVTDSRRFVSLVRPSSLPGSFKPNSEDRLAHGHVNQGTSNDHKILEVLFENQRTNRWLLLFTGVLLFQ